MSARRAHVSLKTKLCSALCQLVRYDEANAEYVKIIPYELSKRLTEDEILRRFDFHHFPIPKAHGGKDVHWNLQPEEKAAHKEITAKIDVPRIAKGKRIERRQAEHDAIKVAKLTGAGVVRRRKHSIPSRPFPQGKRPMQSRGFR